MSSTAKAATSLPLPTTLNGTTVKVRDANGQERAAPLLFVSPTQVNYQIPPGTAPGTATVTITSTEVAVASEIIAVTAVAPGLFSADSSGKGWAAATIQRVKNGVSSYEQTLRYDAAQHQFTPLPIDLSAPDEEANSVEGILIDDRKDEFVAAIKKLKEDPALWKQMSQAARQKIVTSYSVEACSNQWVALLQELSANAGKRSNLIIPSFNLVAQALNNFHYSLLRVGVEYDESGTLDLSARLEGRNPDLKKSPPIHFNLTVQEHVPTLLKSLRLVQDIEDAVQKKFKRP